eukprot:scaffold22592_cov129-Cylindrotheca_fusiformis.AAC.2
MTDNLTASKSDWAGDKQPGPQATETSSQEPAAAGGAPQGRRVTIGGMNRRGSLGLDQINDALFGRRPSGFELDNLFARRGSLDSTTAVFDATLMDLTRRRLSMTGGANDPLSSMDPLAGIGAMNFNFGNMGVMNAMAPMGSLAPASASATSSSKSQDYPNVNARQQQLQQQQLQQQQRELERKQKELQRQREQLIAAMDERHSAMQSMHQKMQLPQNSQQMGFLMGLQNSGLQSSSGPDEGQQWFVCKICNAKAFSKQEEASAHESICMMSGPGAAVAAARRSSLNAMRRSSLDLLGNLTGGSFAAATSDIFAATRNLHSQLPNQVQSRLSNVGNSEAPPISEHMSDGPYAMMEKPVPLSMDLDKDWLTPLHCFVRKHCVHVFTATEDDVATPSKGKRKPIQVGQVGIRCPHCHQDASPPSKERGSVYYPTSIASIYNATMNLLQRHLHSCAAVPQEIMARYEMLKGDDARSGTSKKYWVKSAVSMGLVDTNNGIRYSGIPQPNALPQSLPIDSNQFSKSNDLSSVADKSDQSTEARANPDASDTKPSASGKTQHDDSGGAGGQQSPSPHNVIVTPDDEPYATAFSYHLLAQMQPCVFAEADRLGKRKGLPPGFPGLACKHCYGGYGSGRFFPSSIKTLSDTSKTLNVLHNHMMRCRKCPLEVRENLTRLRKTHDEERAKMKFGSQKAFFARIWDRLHYKDPSVSAKRKFQPPRVQPTPPLPTSSVANFLPGGIMTQQQFNTNQMNMLEALNTMQNMQNHMQYHGAGTPTDLMDSNKRFKMT